MTSSETPIDSPAAAADQGPLARLPLRLEHLVSGGVLLLGFVAILHVNGWRLNAAVFALLAGWLGILISARFLWKTAMVAAAEGEGDDDGFEVASTRRDDLIHEKRAVLKAIKEIEFDHAMGKMSQSDADELLALYRRRAIAIIKELEGGEAGSIAELIDREVKARLAVESAARGAKGRAAKAKTKKASGAGAARRREPAAETSEASAGDAATAEVGDEATASDGPKADDDADAEPSAVEAAGGRSGASRSP